MDPDEVARLVDELKLSSSTNAEQTFQIKTEDLKIGEQRIGSCLVAKIFSPKSINREAFTQQLPRILQATKHIEIGSVGENLFLLDFKSMQDRRRALSGGPWNIFHNLIVFREPSGLQSPDVMNFDEISIWVQCYNLPLVCMHREFLETLGGKIGFVEEIDTRENGLAMGRYARIRIRLDATKPLKKYVRLSINPEDDDFIIILSYERLPDFCYKCGIIGHVFRDCEVVLPNPGKLNYGTWLRAAPMGRMPKTRFPSPKKSQSQQDRSSGASSSEALPVMRSCKDTGSSDKQESDNNQLLIEDRQSGDEDRRPKTGNKITKETEILELREAESHMVLSKDSQVQSPRTEDNHTHNLQKKWKRLACDKGKQTAIVHNFLHPLSMDISGIDCGLNSTDNIPPQKRSIPTELETTVDLNSAVVAKQPRRHQ